MHEGKRKPLKHGSAAFAPFTLFAVFVSLVPFVVIAPGQ